MRKKMLHKVEHLNTSRSVHFTYHIKSDDFKIGGIKHVWWRAEFQIIFRSKILKKKKYHL